MNTKDYPVSMSRDEVLARIDAELARLRALTPLEREQLDRVLAKAHRIQTATALTNKVLGK